MIDKLNIRRVIITEGKYDKIKLQNIVCGNIITTDGFRVFKQTQKSDMIRRLAKTYGIIVLTDSDGAGMVIRNYFNSILPKDQVVHLYIPKIIGKEKRKAIPSKEGTLGVEGMDEDLLYNMLLPYACKDTPTIKGNINKTDLYLSGLCGCSDSSILRQKFAQKCTLPDNLSSNAFLCAINMLYTNNDFYNIVSEIKNE